MIDPQLSVARFSLPYMFVATLKGRFGSMGGDLTIDEEKHSRSSAHASIDVTTIHTGIPLRDAHLRSSQFFHVSEYPYMTFRSRHVDQTASDRWDVIGDLTVRDVTKEVVLATEFHGLQPADDAARRATFRATTTLDRRDFGLGMHGPGGIVGDLVSVTLDIRATSVDASDLRTAVSEAPPPVVLPRLQP